ncbi:MAG: hypothetical protein H5T41_07535 [Methanomassiliicoccales archaeon]|nr:hypothetical protein [Methanomassiliicoccales archaeon]
MGVNRFAIAVIREIRIDILNHRSKSLRKFEEQEFDYVVTVCNDEEDICPFFSKGKR